MAIAAQGGIVMGDRKPCVIEGRARPSACGVTSLAGGGESGGHMVQEALGILGDQLQSDDMCLIGWGRLVAKEETAMRIGELRPVGSNVTTMLRPGQSA